MGRIESSKRLALALTAVIFIVAAVINLLMLLDEGASVFRIIAVIAFAVGGALLLAFGSHFA